MLKELPQTNFKVEPQIHDVGNGHLLTQGEYDELVIEAQGYGPISIGLQIEQRRRELRSAALHNSKKHQ